MLDQILEQSELASCEVITFQVMAVAWVSPGNPDAVGTVPEGGKDEFGAHPRRAWNPDDPDIGRVLKATDPCQVCRAVTAPVAQECGYFGLPVVHPNLLQIWKLHVASRRLKNQAKRNLPSATSNPQRATCGLHFINHRHDLPFLKPLEVERP
jgi:hypothetical protein